MNSFENIHSLVYKDLIEKKCISLQEFLKIRFFVCYIVFNNGNIFILSNTSHIFNENYGEELYKEDYSFKKDNIQELSYYLCDANFQTVGSGLKSVLEDKYNMFRSYYIIRNCGECRFVFGAIKDSKIHNHLKHYNETIKDFEEFCVYFVQESMDIIKKHNKIYSKSLILNDNSYLREVISNCYIPRNELSEKEIECLYWFAHGKSSLETASILHRSEETVNSHRKNILRKLSCKNMPQAILEGVKIGYIGSFNNWIT